MFEITIALRYLIPRRRSLSTALVSLLSVGVISLVVWLVLVFLSVTNGIERNWLRKLTALHAPIRLTPTERYYQSYYFQVDALSSSSNYTLRTIGEKAAAQESDPHSPKIDREIPRSWSPPDCKPDGDLRDLVKETFQVLEELGPYQDYEIGGALLKISPSRPTGAGSSATLSQMSYLLSFADRNPHFADLILPPTTEDIEALRQSAFQDPEHLQALLEIDSSISFDAPPTSPPPWAIRIKGRCQLPILLQKEPILLPKSYRDMGVRIGDRGTLSFAGAGLGAQEQRISIQVAGFYDPGLFSLGGRCVIVPPSVTRVVHAHSQTFSPDGTPTNGIFVWTQHTKQQIEKRLEEAGLLSYWNVATYKDFEFSKELFQQFRSDRTLFLLIAILILLVACCNIISLLVLLVNDKKREIAILQAMGAPASSIATIFGFCGLAMGTVSSLVGILAAIFTLRHLDTLVHLLSALQGHAAFQPAFFGQSLPNQLSKEALLFVLLATPLLSLLAGLIPALKARRIRTSLTLRQE